MSKIAFSIQYAGLTLPIVKNDQGQDVTPLKPITELFGLEWERQRKKVTEGEFKPDVFGTCVIDCPHAGGQNRAQTCIRVDRVMAYLVNIDPERVNSGGNKSGAVYLVAKITEWADALHDYEEIGTARDMSHINAQEALRRQRASFAQMIGIKNKTLDATDRAALGHVVRCMAQELGVPYQADLIEGQSMSHSTNTHAGQPHIEHALPAAGRHWPHRPAG